MQLPDRVKTLLLVAAEWTPPEGVSAVISCSSDPPLISVGMRAFCAGMTAELNLDTTLAAMVEGLGQSAARLLARRDEQHAQGKVEGHVEAAGEAFLAEVARLANNPGPQREG